LRASEIEKSSAIIEGAYGRYLSKESVVKVSNPDDKKKEIRFKKETRFFFRKSP
jgi:hypothetical protein